MPDKMQLLSFDNLTQRILYRYTFTFADFVPIESDAVSVDAQRTFHDFCGSVVRGIFDDPSLLGLLTDHQDAWLEHGLLNMYPTIYKVRNMTQKAFCDLSGFLFAAGLHGKIYDERFIVRQDDLPKLTGKMLMLYIKLFERYGMFMEKDDGKLSFLFPDCQDIFTAWRLLAEKCGTFQDRPKEQAVRFMLWVHNDDATYFLERIRILLGLDEGFFNYIAKKYQTNGYKAKFVINEYGTHCLYSKDVGGLLIGFFTLNRTVRFVNDTCIGIKKALEHADELNPDIKRQIVQFCKPCNDCMGCTKGGKNKQFSVTVHIENGEHRLCPEFVQMEWYNGDISTEKIDFMFELNELQEKFGKNWKKMKRVL